METVSFKFQSPLLRFLAPSVSPSFFRSAANSFFASHSSSRRSFSNQPNLGQNLFSGPSDGDGKPKLTEGSAGEKPHSGSSSHIDQLLNDTLRGSPSPGGSRLRVSDTLSAKKPQSLSSLTAMRDSFAASPFTIPIANRQGSLAESMMKPRTVADVSEDVSAVIEKMVRPRAVRTIVSRPSLGRTIELNAVKGVDLGRALTRLGQLTRQNRIQQDRKSQRFYERPGLKRKRLRSERYRARFKAGFLATVEKVKAMRRKGW